MSLRRIRALATDYDRTLTDADLRMVPRVMAALRHVREAGLKVIVVSGRDAAFLQREVGDVADAIVAENGCFLLHGAERRALGGSFDLSWLEGLGLPEVERGELLASVRLEDEGILIDAMARAGSEAQLIRNRDRVMVLPRGVDKAAGVLAALEALGIAAEDAAAAGDGENDMVMLSAVGYGIAVANAVPELKAAADHVTARVGGDGVADWIEGRWLPAVEAPA